MTSDNDSSGTSHHSQAPTHTLLCLRSSPTGTPTPSSLPQAHRPLLLLLLAFWPGHPPASGVASGTARFHLIHTLRNSEPASGMSHLPLKERVSFPWQGPRRAPPPLSSSPFGRRGTPSPSFPRCPGRFPSLHLAWLIPRCGPHMMEAPSPGFRRHSGILYRSCCLLGTRHSLLRHAHGCQAGLGSVGPEGGRSSGLLFLWLLREDGAQSNQLIPWPHFRDEQLWPRKQ